MAQPHHSLRNGCVNTRRELAAMYRVSVGTVQNWTVGPTRPKKPKKKQ